LLLKYLTTQCIHRSVLAGNAAHLRMHDAYGLRHLERESGAAES
jgi:hypothetical protein